MEGADPGYLGLGEGEGGDVVGLENAEAVHVAPCVEDHEVGEEDLGPGSETAVGRRGRRGRRKRGGLGIR